MAGRNAAIGGGGFHHVAIKVADFDGTVEFYTQALGFTVHARWGEGDNRYFQKFWRNVLKYLNAPFIAISLTCRVPAFLLMVRPVSDICCARAMICHL